MPINETNISKQVKSRKRVTDHGEVFTAEREVNAMLDLVKDETERIDSRFLEPACGTGNFLIEILNRKMSVVESRYKSNQIEFERYSALAVSSIYGIDLLEDNVIAARKRLFDLFENKYICLYKANCNFNCCRSVQFLLAKNIIHGDALTLMTVSNHPKPITFSEWSFVEGSNIKRRDFTLDKLLKNSAPEEGNLFSDLGDKAFIPEPIREFPVINYFRIPDVEN
jgi:hypothetical protein